MLFLYDLVNFLTVIRDLVNFLTVIRDLVNFLTVIRDLANFRAVIRDLANFLSVIRDLGVRWGASLRKRHVWSFNGMSVSEILYGFMFVGIVLANVIVLADDNWRERQIVPHTIRIFVGCT